MNRDPVNRRPPLREAVPLGVQHLLLMLLGNVTPPLIIAPALGLGPSDTTYLVQTALVLSGLATLVQSYGVGRVGGRLPIVMGTSIVFVAPIVAVARRYNLATALGSCVVGCGIELLLGLYAGKTRKLFPPLVSAIVVMLIGLTLVPIGMDYAAGGVGAEDYGSLANLGLAALVLVTTLVLHQRGRGLLGQASLLVGVAAGYVAALALGRVDFTAFQTAGWFSLPRPLPFGLELHVGPILLLAMIYVMSAVETIGDISATVAAAGRDATTRELEGGLLADGGMSGLAALFGGFPNTSFSQNVGLVNFTGVVSRHVTAVTGVFLVGLGLVPKVGSLFTTLPASVVGGAGLVMFAMIFSSGVAILHRGVELTRRNMVILAVSVGLGLGVDLRPDALAHLPEVVRTFFGSGLVTGGLCAALLHHLFRDHE